MHGYEILEKTISDLGIERVFGNPGSTEIPMLRGLSNYVLTLHDSLAVGMADSSAQFTGRPSLVNLHTLPGVANSMAFIHTAKQNRSPVIVTAGQQDSRHMFYEPFLWHDLKDLVGDSVKYSYEITRGEDIERAMKKAFSISLEPPMGPVFLSFPMDILEQDANYGGIPWSEPRTSYVDEFAVDYVSRCLSEAKNPAFIMGSDLDAYGQLDQAEKFADSMGYPVYAEPFASRSPFKSENRRFAGDLLPATTSMNMSLLSRDLVVNFGGEVTMYPYLPSPLLPGKKIINIGLSPQFRHGEYIRSNPGVFMEKLMLRTKGKGSYERPRDISGQGSAAREKRRMGPGYVINRAKKRFGDYLVVDEAVSSSPLVRSVFGYREKSYFTARTGQLGWGLPAAGGFALHTPKVLHIVGDGALMYTVQMLWTIRNYDLPVKILVLDNSGYTILKSFSKSYYPGVENASYFSFENDVEEIASSFGIQSRTADRELNDLDWLHEGTEPKLLLVKMPKEIPRLFP